MLRSLSAGVLLAALLLLSAGLRAAEAPPYVGTWKVVILTSNQELSLLLIKVEEKDGGPKVDLVSGLAIFSKGTKLQLDKSTADSLRFTAVAQGLDIKFVAYPPKGEAVPKQMLGSVEVRGSRDFVRYERTEEKVLDQKTAFQKTKGVAGAGDDAYTKALRTADSKEKEKALKELLEKKPVSPLNYLAELELAGVLAANGAKEEAVKAAAEKAIELAAAYGPEMKKNAVAQVAQKLVAAKKAAALAVAYATRAEKDLPAEATTGQRVAALKTLLSALQQTDRKDETKAVKDRLAGLDKVLDEEYLKDAVPFKTEPFQREGSTGRVAVVELFTGAQCPPCVAADVAFDAALKTYKPQDVVLLQYHLHIPGPDPLTNEDTEKRSQYYEIQGVPSTFVDGGKNLGLGGSKGAGKVSYGRLSSTIKEHLEDKSPAPLPKIQLQAKQMGNNLVITAEVADLKQTGQDTKLRLALVEEVVRYPGRNGQRFHHHVVRAMPGGAAGFALKESKEKQEVKVNLADLKKALTDSLEKANIRRPFIDDERPLELKHLFVVAFIQNDKNKDIIQAAQVSVDKEK